MANMFLLLLVCCLCTGAIYLNYIALRECFLLLFYKTEARSMLAQSTKTQYGIYFKNKYDKAEGFYQTILAEARPFLKPTTHALDVGCGPGRLVFEYEKMGAQKSIGLDSSKQYIRYCNELKNGPTPFDFKIKENSISEFIHADILKNDTLKNSADFISCINVFDRVANPTELFTALYETLTTNGILLITTPYDWKFSSAPKKLHVTNMKDVLDTNNWSIEKEIKDISYTIPIGKKSECTYACHMLILKKK
ncbi:MAG: methyltransferase domain-containing protein [bacterium]